MTAKSLGAALLLGSALLVKPAAAQELQPLDQFERSANLQELERVARELGERAGAARRIQGRPQSGGELRAGREPGGPVDTPTVRAHGLGSHRLGDNRLARGRQPATQVCRDRREDGDQPEKRGIERAYEDARTGRGGHGEQHQVERLQGAVVERLLPGQGRVAGAGQLAGGRVGREQEQQQLVRGGGRLGFELALSF